MTAGDKTTREVEVFEGSGERTLAEGDVLTSAQLPGFELKLSDLFAVIARDN